MKNKIKNILKTNKFIFSLYSIFFSRLLKILGLFYPIKKDQILFVAYGGQRFDDSPKFVYERMKNDKRFLHFKFVWAFLNPDEFPEVPNEDKIRIDTLTYFKEAIKSKYWITNSSASRGLNFMSEETKNIFFTHGMTGIKKIGTDIINNRKGFDLFKEKQDYIVLEGRKEQEIIQRAWRLTEKTKLLNIGLPRNDELFFENDYKITKLKESLSIPLNKKVILYAPTFREYSRDSDLSVLMKPPFNFVKWYTELGDEYILLLTAHYEVSKLLEVPDKHPFVINAFKYPFINDLILVSDLLISDYSSIIFDFTLTEKPVLSFAYDYEEYKEYRGIYDGYQNLFYNGVLKHEEEVIEAIKKLDWEKASSFSRKVKEDYFINYGNATESFLDIFYEEIYEK